MDSEVWYKMLSLETMFKIWGKDGGASVDAALDKHDNSEHGYVPPGAFIEPITPYDEREKIVRVSLGYEEGKDGDVRIVQR